MGHTFVNRVSSPETVSGILGVTVALTYVDMQCDIGRQAVRPIDGGPDSHRHGIDTWHEVCLTVV